MTWCCYASFDCRVTLLKTGRIYISRNENILDQGTNKYFVMEFWYITECRYAHTDYGSQRTY